MRLITWNIQAADFGILGKNDITESWRFGASVIRAAGVRRRNAARLGRMALPPARITERGWATLRQGFCDFTTKEYGATRVRRTRRTDPAPVRSESGSGGRNRRRYTRGSPPGEPPVMGLG